MAGLGLPYPNINRAKRPLEIARFGNLAKQKGNLLGFSDKLLGGINIPFFLLLLPLDIFPDPGFIHTKRADTVFSCLYVTLLFAPLFNFCTIGKSLS
jgi:hypothetical protein